MVDFRLSGSGFRLSISANLLAMAKDYIGYETLADQALRSVVKEALKRAEKQGLLASHHFYITFKTHDPGVDIPPFLKERYPDEMMIVLQNQFWGLKVQDDAFEVSLSFHKVPATLYIPFAALTEFSDPGVQFGLRFRNSSAQHTTPAPTVAAAEGATPEAENAPPLAREKAEGPASADQPQVVSLDKFRKK
jgi:hypothetical protein